jgi:hypothetical protein
LLNNKKGGENLIPFNLIKTITMKSQFFYVTLSLVTLFSCSENPDNLSRNLNTTKSSKKENLESAEALTGCTGNSCQYVDYEATTVYRNQQNVITSMTFTNVSDKPVRIQVEYFLLLGGDVEPWSRYNIPANGNKTVKIDPESMYVGASIKRANIIQ